MEVVSLESAEEIAQRSFPFQVTGLGRGKGKYGYNPRLAPWVNENAPRFDAVVLHGLWNYSSFGAWRGLREESTRYYIFPHGMMDPWFRQQSLLKHFAKQIYWWLAEGRVLRDANRVLFTWKRRKSEHAMPSSAGLIRGVSPAWALQILMATQTRKRRLLVLRFPY